MTGTGAAALRLVLASKRMHLLIRRRARVVAAQFERDCVAYVGDKYDRRRWVTQ